MSEKSRKMVTNTKRKNMFSFKGCSYATNLPALNSLVRKPGRRTRFHIVRKNFGSQI